MIKSHQIKIIANNRINKIYSITYSDLSIAFWHTWYPSHYDLTGGTFYSYKDTNINIEIPIELDINNPNNSIDKLYKLLVLK